MAHGCLTQVFPAVVYSNRNLLSPSPWTIDEPEGQTDREGTVGFMDLSQIPEDGQSEDVDSSLSKNTGSQINLSRCVVVWHVRERHGIPWLPVWFIPHCQALLRTAQMASRLPFHLRAKMQTSYEKGPSAAAGPPLLPELGISSPSPASVACATGARWRKDRQHVTCIVHNLELGQNYKAIQISETPPRFPSLLISKDVGSLPPNRPWFSSDVAFMAASIENYVKNVHSPEFSHSGWQGRTVSLRRSAEGPIL